MSAMDKMISQMLGIDPAELGRMVADFQKAIIDLGAQLNRIEEQQAAILSAIEGKSNDDGNDGGSNRGRTGRGARSSSAPGSGNGSGGGTDA
jgi:hypothetical protein